MLNIIRKNRGVRSASRNRFAPNLSPEMTALESRALLTATVAAVGRMPAIHAANNHGKAQPEVTSRRWQWLANTYWIVPNSGLPAITYNAETGVVTPIQDQTVYHITGYEKGYFWGATVAQYGTSAPSSASLVGSVTPQGKLLLTFNNGSNVTQGYGNMTLMHNQWTMENQMFTGSSKVQVGHWAYMVQTRPGMKSWNSLPYVNQSVPDFLSNYDLPVPTKAN